MGVAKVFQAANPALWGSSTPQARLVADSGDVSANRNIRIWQVIDFMEYFKNYGSNFENFLCTGVC
jgi:hypothetical protein